MMVSSNFTVGAWLFVMIFCVAFDLGFTVYKYVKRRFDEIYSAESVLPKRIIHGVVYLIFLVLAYEAIRVRVEEELFAGLLFLVYIAFSAVAFFIVVDIVVSLRKLRRKRIA